MNYKDELARIKANPNMPIGYSQYTEALEALVTKDTAANAIKVIAKAIKEDPSYYQTWQANLACIIREEFVRNNSDFINTVADLAANNFINLLINIGTKNET